MKEYRSQTSGEAERTINWRHVFIVTLSAGE